MFKTNPSGLSVLILDAADKYYLQSQNSQHRYFQGENDTMKAHCQCPWLHEAELVIHGCNLHGTALLQGSLMPGPYAP